MANYKTTILMDFEANIQHTKERIAALETLTINKTKNGEYFKNISKAGFEIIDKKYVSLVNTYSQTRKQYELIYYNYYTLYFDDHAELETVRDEQLAKYKAYLEVLQERKMFAEQNYEKLARKLHQVYEGLSEQEISLLQDISTDIYFGLKYII